jgi:hypothetical protein
MRIDIRMKLRNSMIIVRRMLSEKRTLNFLNMIYNIRKKTAFHIEGLSSGTVNCHEYQGVRASDSVLQLVMGRYYYKRPCCSKMPRPYSKK